MLLKKISSGVFHPGIWVLLLAIHLSASAQIQVALSFDDPHTNQTLDLNWNQRNESILRILKKFELSSTLYVCGFRIDSESGDSLLKTWDLAGHELANHSYSHWYLNSKKISALAFVNDIKRSDSLINGYSAFVKRFRFPYLKEGNTEGKRDSVRDALNQTGYVNGHVSIDASDWYYDQQLRDTLSKNPNADVDLYKQAYLEHIWDRVQYYDSLASVVGYSKMKHVLLLHHNYINARFLGDLLTFLKQNGVQLISTKEAYLDSIYSQIPMILPTGESIIWQLAKQIPEHASTLRYPAEDGTYEKDILRKRINER